jgi:lipoprotein-anchoring transpeptidase ErfK/SrfK
MDRAGFSCGIIDGRSGANTQRAVAAYRQQYKGDPSASTEPILQYQITPGDVAGPFTENIPSDLMEQSKLPGLNYRSVVEALGERFHTSPEFLRKLNPASTFAEGDTIAVPNVDPLVIPVSEAKRTANEKPRDVGTSGRSDAAPAKLEAKETKEKVTVTVSRSNSSLTVTGADGRIVFFAPVTTGSQHDPLPIGDWKVNGVQHNPAFRYNPDLFWDANPSHSKATIPAGPNGPVGLIWIDISKEHYGLHGSPEPSQIGRTQSHGCVRLTNWDAVRLAGLVEPGTLVRFIE